MVALPRLQFCGLFTVCCVHWFGVGVSIRHIVRTIEHGGGAASRFWHHWRAPTCPILVTMALVLVAGLPMVAKLAVVARLPMIGTVTGCCGDSEMWRRGVGQFPSGIKWSLKWQVTWLQVEADCGWSINVSTIILQHHSCTDGSTLYKPQHFLPSDF